MKKPYVRCPHAQKRGQIQKEIVLILKSVKNPEKLDALYRARADVLYMLEANGFLEGACKSKDRQGITLTERGKQLLKEQV